MVTTLPCSPQHQTKPSDTIKNPWMHTLSDPLLRISSCIVFSILHPPRIVTCLLNSRLQSTEPQPYHDSANTRALRGYHITPTVHFGWNAVAANTLQSEQKRLTWIAKSPITHSGLVDSRLTSYPDDRDWVYFNISVGVLISVHKCAIAYRSMYCSSCCFLTCIYNTVPLEMHDSLC
jgi:hypothetical protein